MLDLFATATIFDFHDNAHVDTTLNDQQSLFTWSLRHEEAVDFRSVGTVILWGNQLLQAILALTDGRFGIKLIPEFNGFSSVI